jgi:hypothetical protein
MISQETIKKFQVTIESEFGVILNDKEATEVLNNWVGYFDLLAKIDHRDRNERIYDKQTS